MMKKLRNCLAAFMGCICIAALLFVGSVNAETEKRVDVLFMHDMHSHIETFAKMKTMIDAQKLENPDTLIVDGGDFSMGTFVQTVFDKEAAELRMMGQIGIDATTLGNHEFDYRSQGLANMLYAAVESGDPLPTILMSNIDWKAMEKKGLNKEQQLLKDAFEVYGVQEYQILEKGDVKIALLGVFGEDSLDCAPTCALKFRDASTAAKEIVDKIEKNEPDVDMIVCLSHGGTWEEDEKSEDEILAKNVPEIDLIISGHTHTTLEKPIRHGDTYIVSCGEYGDNVGALTMVEQEDGIWGMESYELRAVADVKEEEPVTKEKADAFIESVNEGYLKDFGYTKDQVLATNTVPFSSVSDLSDVHTEHNLGSIMADAYRYAVKDHVDVAIVPAGTVRDTYPIGDITVETVFNSFSLGIGADGVPGYPLIKTYLTGQELKIVAEIDASISDLMNYARLYPSGLQFTYNPNRLILNKVTDCYLVGSAGERIELENDKLYCVVADLYSAQMLGSVTDMSYGLLSIVPKFEDGTPVKNYEDMIIIQDGKELKAWAAIASYMESFDDTDGDGIANIPESYAKEQGRKAIENSKKLWDLIKNPNRYAFMIVGIVLVVIILLILLVVLIVKLVKKWRRRRNTRPAKTP